MELLQSVKKDLENLTKPHILEAIQNRQETEVRPIETGKTEGMNKERLM